MSRAACLALIVVAAFFAVGALVMVIVWIWATDRHVAGRCGVTALVFIFAAVFCGLGSLAHIRDDT